MIVKPTGSQILVKLKEVEEKSEGGIVLHTAHQQQREQDGEDTGEVISLGPLIYMDWPDLELGEDPDTRAESWGFKVGDTVMFHRYDGEKPRYPGYEDHRLINCNMIIATVESENA